jgi:hypothetical protein
LFWILEREEEKNCSVQCIVFIHSFSHKKLEFVTKWGYCIFIYIYTMKKIYMIACKCIS